MGGGRPPSQLQTLSLPVGQGSVSRGWAQEQGGQGCTEGGRGWGLAWKVRQFALLILQSGHIVAGVLPLILGGGGRGRLGSYACPSPRTRPQESRGDRGVHGSLLLPGSLRRAVSGPQCLLCAVCVPWAMLGSLGRPGNSPATAQMCDHSPMPGGVCVACVCGTQRKGCGAVSSQGCVRDPAEGHMGLRVSACEYRQLRGCGSVVSTGCGVWPPPLLCERL